jgi:hypothetical protein
MLLSLLFHRGVFVVIFISSTFPRKNPFDKGRSFSRLGRAAPASSVLSLSLNNTRPFVFSSFRAFVVDVFMAFPRKIPFDKPFPGYYKEKFQAGPLAQSVEQRTFNPLVVSSILARPTSKKM